MDVDAAFNNIIGAMLVSVKRAPGQVNNHDPYKLTFRTNDGNIVKILIDGNCYGTICAETTEE